MDILDNNVQNQKPELITAALDLVEKIAVLTEEEHDQLFREVSLAITRKAFAEKEQGFAGICTRLFENIVENSIDQFESLADAEKTVESIIES